MKNITTRSKEIVHLRLPHRVDPKTLMDNPHASFAVLRPDHPVIQIDDNHYLALRAAAFDTVLSDQRTQQVEGQDYVRLQQIPDGVVARLMSDIVLLTNGEAHRQRRRLFALSFTQGTIRAREAQIRRVADNIVADLPRDTTIDFVNSMAARLPAEMIASILGLPASEAPYFAGCVYDLALAMSPIYPIHAHDKIEAAATTLIEYVELHLQDRLKAPKNDLLSELIATWRSQAAFEKLPFETVIYQVLGIILAGSDTTRAGFAMLVALLLQHPEQWAAIKTDPTLIPGAVSEAMRCEPSVGSIPRFTMDDIEIGGALVPQGALVGLSTLSVMRDPALYAEPDRFDICRTDHPRLHPIFGHGPHRCLGEMLARLEMQEGLAALVASRTEIELLKPPRMIGFGGIRQIEPMPVVLR